MIRLEDLNPWTTTDGGVIYVCNVSNCKITLNHRHKEWVLIDNGGFIVTWGRMRNTHQAICDAHQALLRHKEQINVREYNDEPDVRQV